MRVFVVSPVLVTAGKEAMEEVEEGVGGVATAMEDMRSDFEEMPSS